MRLGLINCLLIVIAGFLTYLATLTVPFLPIDDVSMISFVSNSSFTFKSLFLSGANEYYRPLVVISYLANGVLCGLKPASFHMVNVLLHVGTSLLLYWLAMEIFAEQENRERYALLSALFFLLSPLNSEAVTWVSARPDLLCTFFFTLFLVLLLKSWGHFTPVSAGCLAATCLASLMSKEASITLCLMVPCYLLSSGDGRRLKDVLPPVLVTCVATTFYLWLRIGKKLVIDKGVASVVRNVTTPTTAHASILDIVGAYGFYLKKLVWPFPLNFTILEYDKTSAFFFLGLWILASLFLLRRTRLARLPLLIIFLGIFPPILAFIGNIPWTPLGERYLYLPMIGFSLLISIVVAEFRRIPYIIPLACILLLAIPTIQRVALWSDGKAFWKDAIKHTPGFGKSHAFLGVLYLDDHEYDKAEQCLKTAISLGYGAPGAWQNLARVYAAKKEFADYETAMEKAASRAANATEVYQELIVTLMKSATEENKTQILRKAIDYHRMALAKDPSYLDAYYNMGKLYLNLGEPQHALTNFRLYADRSKKGFYRPFALKLIKKIEKGTNG